MIFSVVHVKCPKVELQGTQEKCTGIPTDGCTHMEIGEEERLENAPYKG